MSQAGTPISRGDLERERGVFQTQTAVLEQVARGESLERVLTNLCLLIEQQAFGSICSVLVLDPTARVLRTAAGPNLDPDWADALDGLEPGEGAGSCGTAAIRGEPVIVSDTDIDPLWDAFRELAQRHKIRACWSTPIWSPEGEVLGTFAISHSEPATPDDHQLQLLRSAGHLAGIAIQRERTLEAQRRVESEEQDRQRLESLGALAGGIAHDFNNLLTTVLGNLSMAEVHADSDKVLEYIGAAEEACEQSKVLTGRFLAFAKGAAPVRTSVDLGALVDDCGRTSCAGSNVGLERTWVGPRWVEADPSQLFQVFHNLLVNAVQAMPGGGTIRVEADPAAIGEHSTPALAPGRYVEIAVVDTGTGIEPKDLKHVFDPYFSTKPGGSGLGLSSVYSIVRAHGGHVEVQSEPGQGSRFTMYLPESAAAALEDVPPLAPSETRSGRLLLMDDDPALQRVAEQLLKRAGFEVVCAAEGSEAVDLFRNAQAEGPPFDAVLLDLTIRGGMGGAEAIRRIRVLDERIPAIAVSGYSDDAILSEPRAHGFNAGVAKPFRASELISCVQRMLEETSEA
jgi:signal transduction histidine kinase/CheY-like chemotaxis protein